MMLLLLTLAIPLGLDLYMPVPEENPITKATWGMTSETKGMIKKQVLAVVEDSSRREGSL